MVPLGAGVRVDRQPPILVAFLLWPTNDVIAMPGVFAGTLFEALPSLWSGAPSAPCRWTFTAPFMSTTQGVVPLRMRAFAAAISTLISTLIGLAGGPLVVGALADWIGAAVRGRRASLRAALSDADPDAERRDLPGRGAPRGGGSRTIPVAGWLSARPGAGRRLTGRRGSEPGPESTGGGRTDRLRPGRPAAIRRPGGRASTSSA